MVIKNINKDNLACTHWCPCFKTFTWGWLYNGDIWTSTLVCHCLLLAETVVPSPKTEEAAEKEMKLDELAAPIDAAYCELCLMWLIGPGSCCEPHWLWWSFRVFHCSSIVYSRSEVKIVFSYVTIQYLLCRLLLWADVLSLLQLYLRSYRIKMWSIG